MAEMLQHSKLKHSRKLHIWSLQPLGLTSLVFILSSKSKVQYTVYLILYTCTFFTALSSWTWRYVSSQFILRLLKGYFSPKSCFCLKWSVLRKWVNLLILHTACVRECWIIAHRAGNQYCVLLHYQDLSFPPASCYFKHKHTLHHLLPYSALH